MAHCEEKFETAWSGLKESAREGVSAGNGALDKEEFAALRAAFASIDSNQDGKISFEEMKKVRLIRNQ